MVARARRAHRAGRGRRGRRRRAAGGRRRASSTSTSTCASPARSTRRRCAAARWPRRPAASPPSPAWPTRCRSTTAARSPSTSAARRSGTASRACTRSARSPRGSRARSWRRSARWWRAGAVAISDDGRPVMNAELMRRALLYAQHYGLPVIQHAEDLDLSGGGVMHEGECVDAARPARHPRLGRGRDGGARPACCSRTPAAATTSPTSRRRAASSWCAQAKRRGLPVTCEVTPHHLLLTDEEVGDDRLLDRHAR